MLGVPLFSSTVFFSNARTAYYRLSQLIIENVKAKETDVDINKFVTRDAVEKRGVNSFFLSLDYFISNWNFVFLS